MRWHKVLPIATAVAIALTATTAGSYAVNRAQAATGSAKKENKEK